MQTSSTPQEFSLQDPIDTFHELAQEQPGEMHMEESLLEENSEFQKTQPDTATQTPKKASNTHLLIGIGIALAWHCLYACEPPFTRRLQKISGLSTLALVSVVCGIALVTYFPRLVHRIILEVKAYYSSKRESSTSESLAHRIKYAVLSRWMLVMYLFLTVTRVVTNVYAPRFATAFLVQMITLLSPFITALLSFVLLKERTTWHTFAAMGVTTLSGILVILAGSDKNLESTFWTVDVSSILQQLLGDTEQLIGVAFAVVSTFVHACGAVTTRAAQLKRDPISAEELARLPWYKRFVWTYGRQYHPETLFITQTLGNFVVCSLGSVAFQEDWTAFANLDVTGWVFLALLGSVIFVFAALCGAYCVKFIEVTLASSFLPLRLVITFTLGALFLGEKFQNIYQVAGSIVILLTVTWFLVMQRRISKQKAKLAAASEQAKTLELHAMEQELQDAFLAETAIEMRSVEESTSPADETGDKQSNDK